MLCTGLFNISYEGKTFKESSASSLFCCPTQLFFIWWYFLCVYYVGPFSITQEQLAFSPSQSKVPWLLFPGPWHEVNKQFPVLSIPSWFRFLYPKLTSCCLSICVLLEILIHNLFLKILCEPTIFRRASLAYKTHKNRNKLTCNLSQTHIFKPTLSGSLLFACKLQLTLIKKRGFGRPYCSYLSWSNVPWSQNCRIKTITKCSHCLHNQPLLLSAVAVRMQTTPGQNT